MSAFMWGVGVGAVASPFAWVALKWCYGQVQDRLGQWRNYDETGYRQRLE